MVKTHHVLALIEDPIDTQIRCHTVAVRHRSKANIHTSFFDIVIIRIMACIIDYPIENNFYQ